MDLVYIRFYKLVLSTAVQLSRKQARHKLCSKPSCTTFHVDRLEGCARSKVAGWFICPLGRVLGEDICLLDPWLSYTQ